MTLFSKKERPCNERETGLKVARLCNHCGPSTLLPRVTFLSPHLLLVPFFVFRLFLLLDGSSFEEEGEPVIPVVFARDKNSFGFLIIMKQTKSQGEER